MSRFFAAAGFLIALASGAVAAEPVMPPDGTSLILAAGADGVQVYACEARNGGFAWAFKGPEATLFDTNRRQIGIHGAGPSWKLADGSSIVGEKVSDAPGEHAGDIPWLLLKVKSHDGQGILAAANWVRRAATAGGVAPTDGCDAQHVNDTARMRYSATYQFFR